MSRFFVRTEPEDLRNGRIIITGEDVKHIAGVLRARTGETLVLCDGAGTDYDAVIEEISKEKVITRITAARVNQTEPPLDITLLQGIPKGDKMDLIIQKCVELGVNRFIPVTTARSVVRFRDARDAAVKALRWRRIALEAAKQCDRGRIPVVEEPVGVEEALKLAGGCGLKLLPYEEETDGSLRSVLHDFVRSAAGNAAAIFIGPEGGFERSEAEEAVRSGFSSVKLGPRILRTETAGMAVTSILMYELGDMGAGGGQLFGTGHNNT
jgi:16S rRNA (uracil1498-N3)-methyltransferase